MIPLTTVWGWVTTRVLSASLNCYCKYILVTPSLSSGFFFKLAYTSPCLLLLTLLPVDIESLLVPNLDENFLFTWSYVICWFMFPLLPFKQSLYGIHSGTKYILDFSKIAYAHTKNSFSKLITQETYSYKK